MIILAEAIFRKEMICGFNRHIRTKDFAANIRIGLGYGFYSERSRSDGTQKAPRLHSYPVISLKDFKILRNIVGFQLGDRLS